VKLAYPESPYLLFGFYKQGVGAPELGLRLLELVAARGATPISGIARVPGPNAVTGSSFGDLAEALVWFRGLDRESFFELELVVPAGRKKAETELLGNWRPQIGAAYTPVVSISMGGSAFEPHAGGSPDREGREAYARFLWLCEEAAPTYAAISVEWDLESPEELIEDPRSYAFHDFYLGDALGPLIHSQAISTNKDAFSQRTGGGLYISTNRWFNPKSIHTPSDSASGKVGRLLADQLSSAR